MIKIEKEMALKEKYKSDTIMRNLLACNRNIQCINCFLKHYGSSGLTLAEIGLVLGITRERVRQLESTAIKKLKHPSIARQLRDYINQ